ncbi:MAG: glycosyltransferase family 4 protein [Methyloligellaceae bacterium]
MEKNADKSEKKSKHRVMVAMLGARRHYAVPASLNKAGALEHFYTDICAVKGWPKYLNYIPETMRPASIKRLTGRVPSGVPLKKLTSFPELGVSYAYRLSRARSLQEQLEVFNWVGEQFTRRIDRYGFGEADTVYIFDHNGLDLIKRARAMGLKTVVDVTVAPFKVDQEILAAEHERFPGWEPEDNISCERTTDMINSMSLETWKAADVLVCGSDYVKNQVVASGAREESCVVVPYGIRGVGVRRFSDKKWTGRLKVLTVGAVSLRKGAPYILEAAKRLTDYASFRMVGEVKLLPEAARQISRYINVVGATPRTDMEEHYKWADVFLLPSLNEGSAAAAYEALSYGLPVVCTPNTGSVVRDGIEGFIIEPRNVDAIIERLLQLGSSHSLRRDMSERAVLRAGRYTHSRYGKNLLSGISKITMKRSDGNLL